MSIDVNGFIDEDIQSWVFKHRNDNETLYRICIEINQIAQANLYNLSIHNNLIQEILLAQLYIRALSTYQAGILLCERGMVAETKIILRTLIEILFRISAISKNKDIAEAFVLEDEIHRKKFFNKFKMLSDPIKAANGNPQLDDLINTLNQNITDKDIKELQTQWFAHKAELDDYYNTAYSMFSSSVHATVRDLEELIQTDSTGNIIELKNGPDVCGLDLLLMTAGETMIIILDVVNRVFSLGLEEILVSMHELLKEQHTAK